MQVQTKNAVEKETQNRSTDDESEDDQKLQAEDQKDQKDHLPLEDESNLNDSTILISDQFLLKATGIILFPYH